MSRKDIRQYLEKNILLFDGAMGTYLTSKDRTYRNAPEAANLEKPELIRDIHMEYLQAGSMAITTNTFGANRQNFPDEGWDLRPLPAVEVWSLQGGSSIF